ncbi:MAG: hypothetical protein ACOCS7_01050 [Halolamina sp.]
MDDVTRTEAETPLFAMSVLMGLGALGLATNVAGRTFVVVDPLVAAYAFFAVAFLAGAVHHARHEKHVAAAAHAVAVVGWMTGILGQTVAGPEFVAFSLGTLGASGVALFFAGLQSVGVVGDLA